MKANVEAIFDSNYITRLSNLKNEPEWLLDLRLKGLELYNNLSIVDKMKSNLWSIDNLKLYQEEVELIEEELPEEVNSIIGSNIEKRSVLIYANSSIIYQHLSEELTSRGVIFTTLDNAVREYPDLVKKYINTFIDNESKHIAMHTALWNSGIFIYIPEGVQIDFPIQAMFVGKENSIFPYIILVAETKSKLTFVDNHISNDKYSACFHNCLFKVYVGDGAEVYITTNHNFNSYSTDVTYRKAMVNKDGRLEWIFTEMNFGDTISDNVCLLSEARAEAEFKSIFIGTENQKADFTTKVVHEKSFTESNILYRGIMLDNAKATFNGITKINKDAVKSNAEQVENILMLSEKASGIASPTLLIDEHDVSASHAASVGPVNQDDIYYLMSRGIAREEAERLIIHGFLAPFVSKVPIEGMKELIEKLIERKLSR